MTEPLNVVAGVIWRKNAFLAACRPEGKFMAGYWEFPGGKVEPGETPEDALRRELAEELGIETAVPCYWRDVEHAYSERVCRIRLFHVDAFTGEPHPLEGQELRWVTPYEALSLRFLPVDLPLVQELLLLTPATRRQK